MRFKICYLFLICSSFLYAQEDGLLQSYKTLPDDTIKINLLYEKGFSLRNSDLRSAVQYSKACYESAEKINDHHFVAKALNLRAVLKAQMGLDREATIDFQKALELRIQTKDTLSQAIILNNLGNVYSNFGDNEKALICYERSLTTAKSIFNDEWIQGALLGIAGMQLKMQTYKIAEGNFSTVMEWAASDKRKEILLECYKGVGLCKLHTADTMGAEAYQMQALDLAEMMEDETGKSDCYTNLGRIYLCKKNFKESFSCLQKSMQIAGKNNYKEGMMSCWKVFSDYYFQTQNFKEAYFYLNKHDSTLAENEIQRKDPLKEMWEMNNESPGKVKEASFLSGMNIFQLIVTGSLILLLIMILMKMGNEQKEQKK